jgi:cytochrome c-type biogenesis protein CcmH
VPLLAIALYLKVGSPGLPARPFEARLSVPTEKATVDELVAKVEARLRANPGDGQGWDVLAPVYMVHGRHQDAAHAYARAISLLGETPKRLAGLAEANVLASDGVVNETARLAYERLRQQDPSRPEPRFWLAIADEQEGKLDAAAAAYKALLDSGPADAPWRAMVEERLTELQAQRGGAAKPSGEAVATGAQSSGVPAAGPQAEDIEAASKMTPGERSAMVEGMVGRLAERLKSDGKDLAGWLRLVRAYVVLGRQDEAREALKTARGSFPGEAAALADLDQLAKELGLARQ